MKWSKVETRHVFLREDSQEPWQRNRIAEMDACGPKLAVQTGKPDDYMMDNLKHMIIEEADNMIDESDKENEFAEEREILVKLKKARKKTNILADLIPLNLQEEREKFYAKGCKYDPQFVYGNENLVLKYKKPHAQFVREAKNILDAVLSKYGSDDNFFELQGQVVTKEATGTRCSRRVALQQVRQRPGPRWPSHYSFHRERDCSDLRRAPRRWHRHNDRRPAHLLPRQPSD